MNDSQIIRPAEDKYSGKNVHEKAVHIHMYTCICRHYRHEQTQTNTAENPW